MKTVNQIVPSQRRPGAYTLAIFRIDEETGGPCHEDLWDWKIAGVTKPMLVMLLIRVLTPR